MSIIENRCCYKFSHLMTSETQKEKRFFFHFNLDYQLKRDGEKLNQDVE